MENAGKRDSRTEKIANSVYSPGRARCAYSGPREQTASQRRRPEDDHEPVGVRREDGVDDELLRCVARGTAVGGPRGGGRML